jgi:hypothetical protein
MSQHDYVIDNASGATVRADINSALGAIQSLNSGTSAPSSTAAGMLWLDTTGGAPYVLKVRDAGNNHWLTLGNVTDPGADGNLELLPGKINLPSSGGIYESDGSTEILTESSGAVTLKNTAIDSTVTMSANQSAVKTALNASGSAGIYACRAWVNFNGSGTVAIRDSGNVSSITDNGTGLYTINFTTAMPDTDYSISYWLRSDIESPTAGHTLNAGSNYTKTTSAFAIITRYIASGSTGVIDHPEICINIFR